MTALAALQEAVVAHLSSRPELADLTGIHDGPPPRATFPYASMADGLVSDWSTKSETGREVRFAITLWDDGDIASRLHHLTAATETALADLPPALSGWRIVSCVFLRSLIARDPAGPWAGLVEHRIRLFQTEEN